jgi:hypothetical protein
MCMVLYGYDASVFNWFEWVNLDKDRDTQMIGLSMWSPTLHTSICDTY